jgi:hypothetical protein
VFLPLKSNTNYLFLYLLENDQVRVWIGSVSFAKSLWSCDFVEALQYVAYAKIVVVCCDFAKLTCNLNMHQSINLVVIACYFKF